MDALIECFLDHLHIERNYSAHTRAAYSLDLRQFLTFLQERLPEAEAIEPTRINKSIIRAFLGHLHQNGYARRTIARRFAALRSFIHYLCREGTHDRQSYLISYHTEMGSAATAFFRSISNRGLA